MLGNFHSIVYICDLRCLSKIRLWWPVTASAKITHFGCVSCPAPFAHIKRETTHWQTGWFSCFELLHRHWAWQCTQMGAFSCLLPFCMPSRKMHPRWACFSLSNPQTMTIPQEWAFVLIPNIRKMTHHWRHLNALIYLFKSSHLLKLLK